MRNVRFNHRFSVFAVPTTSAKEEADLLNQWLTLSDEENAKKKAVKAADAELDVKAYAQYPKLTEVEVKTLVVDDKWLATLHGEMDRISQALAQRVKTLAERYESPLPRLSSRVADLEAKVTRHLERMGFAL